LTVWRSSNLQAGKKEKFEAYLDISSELSEAKICK